MSNYYSISTATWITAVAYYAQHLDDNNNVVSSLPEEPSALVSMKVLLKTSTLKLDVAYIASNFVSLVRAIEVLEVQNFR